MHFVQIISNLTYCSFGRDWSRFAKIPGFCWLERPRANLGVRKGCVIKFSFLLQKCKLCHNYLNNKFILNEIKYAFFKDKISHNAKTSAYWFSSYLKGVKRVCDKTILICRLVQFLLSDCL